MRLMQLQKRTMAIAGIVMFIYLIFHMLSNLTFFSKDLFNDFYHWYNAGIIRWLVLTVMVVIVAVHVRTALKIRAVNAKARTVDYQRHDKLKIPASLVTASVLFLLAFMVIHVIQTLGFDTVDVYQQTVALFQPFWMLTFYMAGLFVLTMHLQHSLANVFQTLGKTSFTCQYLAWAVTLSLTGGFALLPLYIYFVMP
jgi:succinate dehydrogenase / fumarate reductase cytochrome b subunit